MGRPWADGKMDLGVPIESEYPPSRINSPPCPKALIVSIVIRNYNYGNYLPDALDSALAQTHASTEVIVVDDGSTDLSQDVLASYGASIRVVYQTHRGEGAAVNAGFGAARGDIVIFLDADDVLAPDAAARVAAAFGKGVARVRYRMWTMAEDGTLLDAQVPALELPDFDIYEQLHMFGGAISASQSANAYARWALHAALPMNETDWQRSPDLHLNTLTSVMGDTKVIQAPLGGYRIDELNTRKNLQSIPVNDWVVRIHPQMFAALKEKIGAEKWSRISATYPAYHWLARTLSYKLNPRHPFKDDAIISLWRSAMKAVFAKPGLKWASKLILAAGASVTALMPRRMLELCLPSMLQMHASMREPRVLRRHKSGMSSVATHWRLCYHIPERSLPSVRCEAPEPVGLRLSGFLVDEFRNNSESTVLVPAKP